MVLIINSQCYRPQNVHLITSRCCISQLNQWVMSEINWRIQTLSIFVEVFCSALAQLFHVLSLSFISNNRSLHSEVNFPANARTWVFWLVSPCFDCRQCVLHPPKCKVALNDTNSLYSVAHWSVASFRSFVFFLNVSHRMYFVGFKLSKHISKGTSLKLLIKLFEVTTVP